MSFSLNRQALGGMKNNYTTEELANIPEYDSIQFLYLFNEGTEADIEMHNIVFDRKTPATYGASVATNSELDGTYVAGVAPDWSIDAGVTATETTDDINATPAQLLSNLNGAGQAFRQTGITITDGQIYIVEAGLRCNSGAGNVAISFDGMKDTATYSVSTANLAPVTGYSVIKFFVVANGASTIFQLTADSVGIELEVSQMSLKPVGGGNHMVMNHSLYDRSERGDNYYDFNGTDHYFAIDEARQSNLDLQNKWSCVTILRVDGAQNGSLTSKWNAVGNQRGWQAFRVLTANRRLETYWSSTGTNAISQVSANNTIPAHPWASYACIGTSFNEGVVTFVLNGVLLTNGSSVGTGTTIYDNTTDVLMGAAYNPTGDLAAFFEGRLGKQIIWSGAALTLAQHKHVFNILRSAYGI